MADKPEKVVPTLENAYPKESPPAPAVPDNSAELKQLKDTIEDMKSKASELEKENDELKKKLADIEHENLIALAEKVADIKVGKGLLKDEEKEKAVKELSEYDVRTLELLEKELSSLPVKLTQTPKPLTTPAPEPNPQLSPEQDFKNKVEEMTLKLFGHKNDPVEYYGVQKEKGEL